MNILFVVPRLPEPPDTGGKIRTYNLIKQARAYGHEVTVLPFSGQDRISAKSVFLAIMLGLPLSVAKYRSREMAEAIVRIIRDKKIDIVHFDHVHMGQYLEFCPGVPAVIDEHNVECLILSRLAKNTGNLLKKCLYAFEAGKMKDLEKRLCSKASRVFFVSEEDKQNYGKFGARLDNAEIIPNGVDVEYFRKTEDGRRKTEEDALVFTGSMDWLPNSDAVEYFCREILPLIWAQKSDIKFYVVGKNPSQSIKKLGKGEPRIVVTGSVPDVRPYVDRAKIFVVPLRIGGGTRLKILEAMAMQKAVVSTTIGAEGIVCVDGQDIAIADSPQDFADKVIALLEDRNVVVKMEEAGRRLVCSRYAWEIIGKKLNSLYQKSVGYEK